MSLANSNHSKSAQTDFCFVKAFMTHGCKSIGCSVIVHTGKDFCPDCQVLNSFDSAQASLDLEDDGDDEDRPNPCNKQLIRRRRPIQDGTDMDVFAVHQLFEINDFSGCIQQASSKLLLSSDNSTCKPRVQDISDARDILNRWLELNNAVH